MTPPLPKRILPVNVYLVGWLLLALPARAQRYPHYTIWSRVQVQKRLSNRVDLLGEYHFRQQNDLHDQIQTPLDRPLVRAFRLVGSYRAGAWTFQFNPSFFRSHQLIGKEDDFATPPNPEWRLAAYVEWARTWQRFTLRVRPGYEYRFQERNDYVPTGRARFRVQGRYALTERTRWVLGTEPLLNVGPNPSPVLFSQNQAYTGLDFDLCKTWLGLEVGYLYVFRQRRTRVEFDDEHALNVQLKFRL